ncbi:hypothetical protein DUK53_06380 [Listeria sp. SHR_NRA_18]|uniref:DUF5696 domain-containing protein n=1 Tax=Listeria sp. SHR_NRA_18 TaxID=2269046 RepID=UPI00051DE507|nr:DUF5696 domain-containing protein [Listeria sp. SHR_NRA_18]KGL41271.1 hypothetical protein EP56_11845 [Listeriaceae bacterium FSL A5-0209]RQW67378.1 hypothetical protein DUK53_06380 [Listeria sp. SHR_NRA_18]
MFKKILMICAVLILAIPVVKAFAQDEEKVTPTVAKVEQTSGSVTQKEVISKPVVNKNAALDGFDKVAENANLALYVHPDSLAIKVRNRASGYVWSSTLDGMSQYRLNQSWKDFVDSAITMDYLNAQGKKKRESLTANGARVMLRDVTDGFEATITFRSRIKMNLKVTLAEDGVHVAIPDGKIVEPGKVQILAVNVYPFLGATKDAEVSGYMFIPDGSGGLIRYEDTGVKMDAPYSAAIYGTDVGVTPVTVAPDTNAGYVASVPVFGMVHGVGQNGMLAVVEKGAEYGEITAYKAGLSTDFNWITAGFTYRSVYKQPTSKTGGKAIELYQDARNRFDIGLTYRFLDGVDADYVGMAKSYRAYLAEQKVLVRAHESGPVMRLEFLGGETKPGLFRDSVVVMTPVADLTRHVTALGNEGVDDLLVVYQGWNHGGLSASWPNKFPFEKKLGSDAELADVMKALDERNVPLYFQTDYTTAYEEAKGVDASAFAKQINTKTIERDVDGNVVYSLLPDGALELAKVDAEDYVGNSMTHLAVANSASMLYSTHNSGHSFSRSESMAKMQAVLAELHKNAKAKTALYQPNDYAWKHATAYLDMPMGTSEYIYESDAVPFLAIVLKGYMDFYAPYSNFSASQTEDLLQLVDFGAFPSFYLTSEGSYALAKTPSKDVYTSQFSNWKPEIKAKYEAIAGVAEATSGATIERRDIVTPGVVCVTYSNGTRVVVNYTKADYVFGNKTVAAKDFAVLKGDN